MLLQPGWPQLYGGQYMRDAFYGTSNALDLLPNVSESRQATAWVFARQRDEDGAMPQMVSTSGEPQYSQTCFNDSKPVDNGTVCVVSDSGPFAVKSAAVWTLSDRSTPAAERIAWFRDRAAALERGLLATPLKDDLTWSDPKHFIVGYGFADTVVKTGHTMYSSVLYYEACVLMADMARFAAPAEGESAGLGARPERQRQLRVMASRFEAQAARTKRAINARFWDDELGGYRAADGVESDRLDVWGTGLAAYLNVSNGTQADRIFRLFKDNATQIFWEGQVREVVAPRRWEQMRGPHSRDWSRGWDGRLDHVYQNGGYWATPLDYVLPFIGRYDMPMACELLLETVSSFRTHGINEWVGPFWPSATGAPGYTASAADVYAASKALRCEHA